MTAGLAAAYHEPPAGLDGVPLLAAAPPSHRPVFTWGLEGYRFVGSRGKPAQVATFQDGRKYVVSFPGGQGALSDPALDPDGAHDLSAQAPGLAVTLRRAVDAYVALDPALAGLSAPQ